MILNNVVLALGSNIGDRLQNLSSALKLLTESKILNDIHISSLYETKALVPENAPKDWNNNFYNIAIKGQTPYKPLNLLHKIKQIELDMGRQKREKWAPREIDIDILVYDNQHFNLPELTIPHIGLLDRDFFLFPLAELWDQWRYPIKGKYFNYTANELANNYSLISHILTIQQFKF